MSELGELGAVIRDFFILFYCFLFSSALLGLFGEVVMSSTDTSVRVVSSLLLLVLEYF